MVKINQIKSVLSQFEVFFLSVKKDSENDSDIGGASYGMSKIKFIRSKLNEYEKHPQKKTLKQIDAGFVSMTRGVEGFGDYKTNKEFYELFKEIPDFKSWVKS